MRETVLNLFIAGFLSRCGVQYWKRCWCVGMIELCFLECATEYIVLFSLINKKETCVNDIMPNTYYLFNLQICLIDCYHFRILSIEGNLHQNNILKTTMRPSINTKNDKSKLSHYQQFRNRTKTESKCNSSSLIPDLNDLDLQVKQYEQLRSKKLSQSQVQGLHLKEISNLDQLSSRVQKSHRLFTTNLQTIEEFQAGRQPGRSKTNMLNSCLVSSKNQKPAQKLIFAKSINGKAKQQALKRQKIQNLKAKTKQLQNEILGTIVNDPIKKNLLNRQFSLILKLLE